MVDYIGKWCGFDCAHSRIRRDNVAYKEQINVDTYTILIKKGKMTLEDVPVEVRQLVEEKLNGVEG